MSYGFTQLQADTLAAIRKLTVNGVAPSFDEIKDEIGTASKSNVHRILASLRERGAITSLPGKARSIRVVEDIAPVPDLDLMTDRQLTRIIGVARAILTARESPDRKSLNRYGRRA